MRIVAITAENVKRLKVVNVRPDGTFQVIGGMNEQGKTSLLDALWLALAGSAAARKTPKPIRDGQDSAQVTVDLGEYVVTRTWKGDKTTLKVESPQGAQYKAPQAILDSIIGKMSFDPLAFLSQDAKTQVSTLLDLVDLPFDPEDLDRQRLGLYTERTEVGRELRAAEATLRGVPEADDDIPAAEISMSDIAAEIAQVQAEARLRANDERAFHLATAKVSTARSVLRDAKAAVVRAESAVMETEAVLDAATVGLADWESAGAPPDSKDLEARLRQVEEINAQVRLRDARDVYALKVEFQQGVYDSLTARIDAVDQTKRDGLAAATFPIDGLGFDDDGVTYQGVPLMQASGAGRLRVGMSMAMALNPTLRVIRITDGSLLDESNLALIEQMAKAKDFQILVEVVGDPGGSAIILEDGLVVPTAK